MSDEWLHAVLERMQADINEIKADVRPLRDFRLKMTGAVITISALSTLAINAVIAWLSHH